MATGSSTQNVVPPVPQGIKSGKHQAKGQEQQKKGEGDAQGRRRALKWAEGPGCWKGEALVQPSTGLAPGCGFLLPCAGTGIYGGGTTGNGPEPTWRVVFRLGKQVIGAGRWEGDPDRLCRTLKLRAVFAQAVSCCSHICARAAHPPRTFAPSFFNIFSLSLAAHASVPHQQRKHPDK